jgi:hypothetical protein
MTSAFLVFALLFLLPGPASPSPRLPPGRAFAHAPTTLSPQLTRGSQGCIGGVDWFSLRRRALGSRRAPPLLDLSPAQLAANSRVLVISSDTRPLAKAWANRTYSSLSMILNRQYAHAHGYDFAFVRTFASSSPPGANREERDAACFHPAFSLWRVHNWCKVLTLWAATAGAVDAGGAPLYDLVVYLDSDAIVQDLGADVSESWSPAHGGVVHGAPFCGGGGGLAGCTAGNGSGPVFVFYSDNAPGEPASPNLGYFAMRNVPRTLSFLRDWWDFKDDVEGHKFATYAFHEQTGMWRLMQPARGWGPGVTVLGTRWAPDDLAKMVRHINSEENRYFTAGNFRVNKFSAHAEQRGIAGAAYEAAVADTIDSCDAVDLDVLDIVKHLDAWSARHGPTVDH